MISGREGAGSTSQIEELLANNQAFAAEFDAANLGPRPGKSLAVVACMDARVDVHKILGLGLGDAHVIRNAGGVVTDDVLRSLLISQRLLGTHAVLVMQHTRCGLLGLPEEDVLREIEAETGARPPFNLEGFSDLEESVRRSVDRVCSSAFIPHVDLVRGFVYDVATGSLSEVPAAADE